MQKNNFLPKIPYGTKDFLPNEAEKKRKIEEKIARKFSLWGYKEVITPTYEYIDIFDSSTVGEQSFKFFDRKGNCLVLRTEMTAPVARVISTRLKEQEPKKICYIANVFRHEVAQAGRQCEFYQAGVELLGEEQPASAAEVIALAVETIRCTGLENFKINMGHVGFLHGLIKSANLSEEQESKVRNLLLNKDIPGMENFVEQEDIAPEIAFCLKKVPFFHGGIEILDEAKVLANNVTSTQAIEDLKTIYEMLKSYDVIEYIDFDLGIVRDFGYYTGMVFEGYTYGTGYPICGGGRYDKMMARFGEELPAIGFSIGIDRILLIVGKDEYEEKKDVATYIAWNEGFFEKAVKKGLELRNKGLKSEIAFNAQSIDEAKKSSIGKKLIYLSE